VTPGAILRIGRVSNLPTVWTNALAGAVLAAGGAPDPVATLLAALALTLFYEGGMWLNDAFDARIDARERADRPIPKGEIGRGAAFAVGGALLAAGAGAAFAAGPAAGLVGLALGATVLLYDWLHKRTVLAPLLMGAARLLAVLLGAAAAGGIDGAVWLGAAGLFAHVVGLTYAAKREAHDRIGAAWPFAVLAAPLGVAAFFGLGGAVGLAAAAAFAAATALALRRLRRRGPGDVRAAVVVLIAAVSLYDAALIGGAGAPGLALLAAAGFALTLALQRVASGT
jgi:4-hydroxybenzoate polyprenyltransferase